MISIPDIQYITRNDDRYSHAEQARIMFEHGISWVQIRMKDAPLSKVIEQAEEAMHYANLHHATLIINDSIEVTKQVKAHGIHLGLKDISIHIAREHLGPDAIIGGTANTYADIRMQIERGADYVGLGPFRFTHTKKNLSPVIGLEGYSKIHKQLQNEAINTPVIAVGGIEEADIQSILETGLNGVAISGALFNKIIKQQ